MNTDEIIRMAREAGFYKLPVDERLERFAALVAAHEREKQNWKYNPETGEPLIDGWPLFSCLPPVSIEVAVLAEREACAKVCDVVSDCIFPEAPSKKIVESCAAAIRARGENGTA